MKSFTKAADRHKAFGGEDEFIIINKKMFDEKQFNGIHFETSEHYVTETRNQTLIMLRIHENLRKFFFVFFFYFFIRAIYTY